MSWLDRRYFEWLCGFVIGGVYTEKRTYDLLLQHLHQRSFTYTIALDGNRAADGEDLRYRFAEDCGCSDSEIAVSIDIRCCSILEMMVALAVRIEEHIMTNSKYGNRTSQWFWDMIRSLGLWDMTDHNFDENRVDDILDHFLDRDYDPDGHGGLFTVPNPSKDMRGVEIWYQMCMYLDEFEE